MKEEKHYQARSYVKIINIYLLACIVVLIISIPLFNSLINKHDLEMSKDICNLIAEKMNNSITYMTESVKGRAEMLSSYEVGNWNALYESLSENLNADGCNSIGLIDKDNNFYGKKNEELEFEKWGLIEQAKNTDKVFFSAPYRQGTSGKMVLTVFAPIYQDDEQNGVLFMTYNLEEFQNMAKSNIVENDMEIYLMNPYSHNYVRCFGADKAHIGSWNNTKLLYDQIETVKGKTFAEWEENMLEGKSGEAVFYKMDKKLYTQVFVNIDVMENWSVVVRISEDTLSNNLRVFHTAVIGVSVALIFSLFVMFILSNRNASSEKKKLEYLSNHDPLTKLKNRRAFEKIYDNYLVNKSETSMRSALIFFDIDYFKQINDGFGHAMGDRVLQEFANIGKEVFSDNGTLFRLGGDEFILLIQNFDSRETVDSRMNEFRRRLKALDFLMDKEGIVHHIHFSAGIVELTECMESYEAADKKADKVLYQVKQRGRDGFAWYSET